MVAPANEREEDRETKRKTYNSLLFRFVISFAILIFHSLVNGGKSFILSLSAFLGYLGVTMKELFRGLVRTGATGARHP